MIKLIKRKNYKISNFVKNIIKLSTSISVAQIIPLIVTPILTQYFSPSEFGVYGLYISICTIVGVIASGKYDVAIMLPKKKSDSVNLLALSCIIAFLFSLLFLSLLNIFNEYFFEVTKSELLTKYYFIIPISVFLISINQSIIVWFNRSKKYNIISAQNILKSSSNSVSSLFMGVKNISYGLIFGHITSITITSFWNIYKAINQIEFELISIKIMKKNFKKYIDFLKYSTTSNLFNSISNIGMTTMIIIFYGPKIAGLYFLAEKLISVPISFITNAISQVYFEKASKLFYSNKHKLLILTNQIQTIIFLILFPCLLLISIFGENIFSILGDQWAEAGIMIKYFSVFILIKNLYSPISHIGDILNKQKLLLFFNVSLVICQIASFYFLKNYGTIQIALLTASCLGAIHYLILNEYMKSELARIS